MDIEIWFRSNYIDYIHNNHKITIFRPNNRFYPNPKSFSIGMVERARVIEIPGNDKEGIRPKFFPNIVEFFKVHSMEVFLFSNYLKTMNFPKNIPDIKDYDSLMIHLKSIYGEELINNTKELTMINLEKIKPISNNLDNTDKFPTLFEKGLLKFAKLPENNIKNIDELMKLDYFSLVFINHDYAGLSPKMWNAVTKKMGLNIGTSMVVADPKNLSEILDFLRYTKKYIGGGFGVGFKDTGFDFLKQVSYGYVNPLAEEMGSINFGAHFGDEIHGFNSDAIGYVTSLGEKFESLGKKLNGSSVIVLGAGGTGRGICFELLYNGVKNIIIINRTLQKAQNQADKLNLKKSGSAFAFSENENLLNLINKYSVDAIINVSTKGADGDFEDYNALTPTNISKEENKKIAEQIVELIPNKKIIFSDINLTKTKTTPFLQLGEKYNFPILDGKKMVVYQGVEAVWIVLGHLLEQKGFTKKDIFNVMNESVFGKQ